MNNYRNIISAHAMEKEFMAIESLKNNKFITPAEADILRDRLKQALDLDLMATAKQ